MDELQRRVVAAIRALADKQQIALTHLPDRAGVARSHFWNVVNGTTSPTLRWISKIAKALDVSAPELFQLGESVARAPVALRAAESHGPRWRPTSRRKRRKRSSE